LSASMSTASLVEFSLAMPPRYLTRPSRGLPVGQSKIKPVISNGPLLRPARNASCHRVDRRAQ
jgi:hypothetical protein